MSETFTTGHPQPLGREAPPDLTHLAAYPLTPVLGELTKPVPVAIGVNWYSNFDRPVYKNGRWWIGQTDDLGYIRGGHEICLRPDSMTDLVPWWQFYDQGREGACVGFACSRMMTLLNRAKYDAPWLYHQAQAIDGWPLPHEGTSGRAACEILRAKGHKTPKGAAPKPAQGISVYRWAQSVDEINACLQSPNHQKVGGVPFLNSWGANGYPHITFMPFDVLNEIVFNEGGDAAVVTDR